ncbi:uncharacterized protein LOC131631113 [Vicia villosa]|uniref:uncharacterized protein LOC131631113 n=1 Tax=Vicia villosa TaxID=3911 RepID=UPI00273B1AC4|nr:uncharacterized protein LOC131631113 [Vicia villosa]
MSQQSDSSSPKKLSPTDAHDSVPRTEPVNPNQVLNIASLRMVSAYDLKIKKSQTPHARRPKETVQAKDANPSLSISRAKLPKEGSKYVHEAITKIITRILDEQRQVPGISAPLQTIIPDSTQNPNPNVAQEHVDVSMDADNVHEKNDDVQMTDEEKNDEAADVVQNFTDNTKNPDVQGNAEAADVTQDVTDNNENDPNDDSGNNHSKKAHDQKGKKVANQSPPKKKVPKTTSTGPIRSKVVSKSTSIGPSKIKTVSQSVPVGPSKSWRKVIPKKRKAQVMDDSDSNVEVDVQRIQLKKKPTSSKLAAKVPNVPIDNISFHSTSSLNRWKYVYQKRLALERELAQNALDCKDIMELIHAAGLMKIVAHFATCYEVLVKEFILNLSEEYADRNSKEFRKVYVRGRCVTFSSTVINNYLGRSDEAQPELEVSDNKVCQVITANQIKSWRKLSMKYAMLHKIGAINWVPINHKSTIATVLGRFIYVVGTKAKFDYGTYIFNQTMKHAGSFSVKGLIAFPSLIYGIILNQYPGILVENDSICKRESALSFHYKLFQGTHPPDVVMTSVGTSKGSSTTGKAAVVAICSGKHARS